MWFSTLYSSRRMLYKSIALAQLRARCSPYYLMSMKDWKIDFSWISMVHLAQDGQLALPLHCQILIYWLIYFCPSLNLKYLEVPVATNTLLSFNTCLTMLFKWNMWSTLHLSLFYIDRSTMSDSLFSQSVSQTKFTTSNCISENM